MQKPKPLTFRQQVFRVGIAIIESLLTLFWTLAACAGIVAAATLIHLYVVSVYTALAVLLIALTAVAVVALYAWALRK